MTTLRNDTSNIRETILIVDDNEDTNGFIRDLVSEEGFKTAAAECGKEAIEKVSNGDVDLVLLDVMMPDMSGIDVATEIKKLAGTDFLPVIMVTALCSSADKVEGLMHADDYLTKPFSAEELLARINSLLRIRRLNKELQFSKAKYECLYENFPHLYISVNSDRVITNCNRFFRDTFKVDRNDVLGKNFSLLFREQDQKLIENFLSTFTLADLSSIGQRVFPIVVDPEMEPRQLSLKAVYTGEEDDELSIVIAMEDITEQLKMQEEQKLARQQLYRSARLASIGTLASGVAHEINNPLTAILGFSSSLYERAKNREKIDEDELEEYLGVINQETLRCRDIIDNLTKFSRESETETKRVNLKTCIEDALKLTHAKANKMHVSLTNRIVSDVYINSDANKLEQVFINIITNCIDFCPAGSVVEIEKIDTHDSNKFCRIHITDNGPGISTAILPKVFDLFFTTKEVGKGTGMGLAICHKIIEECKGRIDIDSGEDKEGTTVILELPVSVDDENDLLEE
jgi:PAS domain S-box-containing protein